MALKAFILNCTLKPSGQTSNTQVLIDKTVKLFEAEKVAVETARFVDYNVKYGTSSDEGKGDEWPQLLAKIKACDIFILASPVWMGSLASSAQKVIERLDATFHEEKFWDKETGQYFTYNKVAGCICTGNEDGAHEVARHILWAMQELGFTVPPNVNTYWVGVAGEGPSYIKAGGQKHFSTNKTNRFMVANLIYFANLLKQNPIPTNLNKLSEAAQEESIAPEQS